MGKLREIKSIAVLFGIISIVLGIVLVVIPGQTQLIINTIVGVALLVVGCIAEKEVKPQRSDGDFACGDSYFRIVRLVESRCYNIHCRNSNGSVCTRHGN